MQSKDQEGHHTALLCDGLSDVRDVSNLAVNGNPPFHPEFGRSLSF